MEIENSIPKPIESVDDVKKFIKDQRKPAAQAVAGQQEEVKGAPVVDEERESRLLEIEICMKSAADYKVISDYLNIVDMPGIEDGVKADLLF